MTSTKRSGFSPLTTKLVGFAALALATFGGTGIASARGARAERGTVVARGLAVKVVAEGPIALHAYSQVAGGSLFTAPMVTGTDRDCQAAGAAANMAVEADRIATFAVGEGQVACLSTNRKGSFELLWHAVSQPVPAAAVYAKAGR